MITYQTKNSWGRPLLIALVGSVAVGTGVWWWMGHSESGLTTPVSTAASESSAPSGQSAQATVAPASTDATILPDGRPSDFPPAIWSSLNKIAAKKPQLKPEVDKVVSYMRFQRDFERWQSLEDSRDAQQRHQLARVILDQMPERLSKGEFSMSESLMMGTVLMSDLEPDEKKREQMIDDWGKKLAVAVPQPADDTQIQELQKRTEELRAVPEMLAANPDDAKLEQALTERSRISR